MNKFIIYFTVVLFIFLISCTKDEEKVKEKEKDKTTLTEDKDDADTNLTPPEKFSSSVLIDFLDDSDDEELAYYLEEEFYKNYSGKFKGASVLPISSSFWLITLEDPGQKNFLLQKFVDLKTNEYYFKLNETSLKAEDIISRYRYVKSSEEPTTP